MGQEGDSMRHLLLQARQLVTEGFDPHARLLQLLTGGAGGLVILLRAQLGAVQLRGQGE